MPRPKNEFQTVEQIRDTARKLAALSELTDSLAESLLKMKAKGGVMAAPIGLANAVSAIHGWLESGFLQVANRVEDGRSFGIDPPDGVITGYDRETLEPAVNKANKVLKKEASRPATK